MKKALLVREAEGHDHRATVCLLDTLMGYFCSHWTVEIYQVNTFEEIENLPTEDLETFAAIMIVEEELLPRVLKLKERLPALKIVVFKNAAPRKMTFGHQPEYKDDGKGTIFINKTRSGNAQIALEYIKHPDGLDFPADLPPVIDYSAKRA